MKQVDPPALAETNQNNMEGSNSQQQPHNQQENSQNVANSDEQKANEATVTQNQEQQDADEHQNVIIFVDRMFQYLF